MSVGVTAYQQLMKVGIFSLRVSEVRLTLKQGLAILLISFGCSELN